MIGRRVSVWVIPSFFPQTLAYRANIRLWQTALGATPTLLAMNSERRAVGKV